jgi:hypothetical protein
MIEQSLDVDNLAADAPRDAEQMSLLGAGVFRPDTDALDRFSGGVRTIFVPALRLSSLRD